MHVSFALAIVASVFLSLPSFAETTESDPPYREGTHYYVLPEPVAVEAPGQIEVTEVFWYGCGHCFHFEPRVVKWAETKADDVNFVKLPAMWNRPMEAHARAFYTARELGILKDVHQALYNALNIHQQPLDSAAQVAALFAEFGADEEGAVETFESAAATAFLKQADAKARAYQISGTPQLIVHGRYRIEASEDVPQSKMFEVVDFLVGKVRDEGTAAQQSN